jgi:hypothetical protein
VHQLLDHVSCPLGIQSQIPVSTQTNRKQMEFVLCAIDRFLLPHSLLTLDPWAFFFSFLPSFLAPPNPRDRHTHNQSTLCFFTSKQSITTKT